MIQYRASYSHPHRQFLDLEMSIENPGDKELVIQLPSWRPGRYELGNFAKNIRGFMVEDQHGKALAYEKRAKDTWIVKSGNSKRIVVRYSYYSHELNAGSTFVDENQMYVNPVNCFMYLPDFADESYEIHLDLPASYEVACGLEKKSKHVLLAGDYQELFDCPWIASAGLKHWTYESSSVLFHIWVQGGVHFDADKFVADHKAFSDSQIRAFGDFPCAEYHFLYQFPDFSSRHGVEHSNSTVITMGPAIALKVQAKYDELIGISCHELYHTWNIKNIRPIEMMPYDYTVENYSKLGYVAEGVTTYFGDQFLWRAGVFSDQEFYRRMTKCIERYLHNPGRFNYSVAESSLDTWLDGYVQGIPWRKVSIYNEGLLIAWICDVRVLKASAGVKSLDDVMQWMYRNFGMKGVGYTAADYLQAMEEVSGVSFQDIQELLIDGTEDYLPFLKEAMQSIGMQISICDNQHGYASKFGFQVDDKQQVNHIEPNSPADQAGLWYGDKIIAVDGQKVLGTLEFTMENKEEHRLICFRRGALKKIVLKTDDQTYLPRVELKRLEDSKQALWENWKR